MQPFWESEKFGLKLFHADCLELLPQMEAGSVDCVVTDPPWIAIAANRLRHEIAQGRIDYEKPPRETQRTLIGD